MIDPSLTSKAPIIKLCVVVSSPLNSSGPIQFLEQFQGYLQTDGYGAYENPQIGGKSGMQLIHCMAHARRYAEKSLDYDKERSEHFLSEIQKLYAIERHIRENNLTGEQVLIERQQKAKPILEAKRKLCSGTPWYTYR